MHAQRKDRRGDLIPVIVAAFVAVVGQTVYRLRPEQRFAGQRQRDDDHGRGGVQGRRNRDPVGAARRPVGILSAVKTATMIGPETYSCPGRRPVSQRALKLALSLVALTTSLASLFAASWVGLALQLLFLRASESMGNHDSKIVDAGSVD